MLHATSAALSAHLETALAGCCAVTTEPPGPSVTAGPEGAGGEQGLGVHLFHLSAVDLGRAVDAAAVRDGTGRVVGRRPPVRRYRTRWLVWAWAPTAPARLALLDEALTQLTGPVLAVGPELAEGGPVHLEAAPAGSTAGELAGVFAGLCVPARPALELVVTAGLVAATEPVPAPPSDVRVVSRPRRIRPH
ncbi:hypothetical protein ACIQWR_37660 [Streptomyces sp. NPDC098789]|uniref:hypothetical protein n=1 Tax=Streptomyces sp. NPDC098789 TaxID=3366098 RepID=UPI0038243264